MEDYEINSATLAVVPVDEETSIVYEPGEEYLVNKSANSIIKYNCEYFGSSYQGRCEGTKNLTGIKTKFPVIIEESRSIIFFPTTSARSQQTTWLALNKIKEYHQDNLSSKIVFNNNKEIKINISIYSLENQIIRASMLKNKLYERKLSEKAIFF